MNGTEISRITGSYTTAYVVTSELISQSQANNTSTIKLRGYFYYGGGTQVNSASSSFVLNGTTIKSGSYSYTPGYTLLGEVTITVDHDSSGVFPTTTISSSATSYHITGSTTGQITGIANILRGTLNINVSGTWKQGQVYVNVSGTWKQAVGIYTNVNGVWKQSI